MPIKDIVGPMLFCCLFISKPWRIFQRGELTIEGEHNGGVHGGCRMIGSINE